MVKNDSVKSILKKPSVPMNKSGLGSKIRNIKGCLNDGLVNIIENVGITTSENSYSGLNEDMAGNDASSGKKDVDEGVQNAWADPNILLMKNISIEVNSPKQTFANVVNGTSTMRGTPKVNFRAMVNPDKVVNSYFVLPIAAVHAVKHKYENSFTGFFVGKKVAFPLVKNYVTNTWAKFGFEKIISDDDGVFYFKFSSLRGLEQVLEQGPWLIRNIPLILTKWTPNLSLSKDNVTRVPVWSSFTKYRLLPTLKMVLASLQPK
ncbi:retrovirus-related pol polyprotein from transposon TNT 1-94 [Tanacetum coccineum]